MKVAVMYSGGKDSNFAVEYAQERGWEISYLLSVKPTRTDCYLFHYATVEHTPLQAKAMGLKHILVSCSVADPVLEANIVKGVVEKNMVDAVILGGTGLQQTQIRSIQNALLPLGVEVFASHSGQDHDACMHEMIKRGYDIRMTQFATDGLTEKWLGKRIDVESYKELEVLSKKFGFHIGGEGGYYDSFVCDAPMFKQAIVIEEAHPVMESNYNGFLKATTLKLVDKIIAVEN